MRLFELSGRVNMPLFLSKVIDSRGKIVEDTIHSASREEAALSLKADGFKVLSIKSLESNVHGIFGRGIKVSEKASFCRFIAVMLRSGLSLPEAVEIIKQESENKRMQKILSDIAFQTRKGSNVSSVLSQYKSDFDPVFLTMIKAGEESGTLDQAFDYLSKQLFANYELTQKVKNSMMYPAVIFVSMVGVGLLMLLFVLPKISSVFTKLNIPLPFFTTAILNFGNFVGKNTPLVLVVIALVGFLAFLIFFFKKTRNAIFHLTIKFPLLRKIAIKVDVARFSRTLSTLLRSGVQITTALNVSADTLSQPNLKKKAKEFATGVSKGESLSSVLSSVKGTFPLVVIQTIKAGEKTGRLDEVLEEMAGFYENEVENDLKRLTSLLEPLLSGLQPKEMYPWRAKGRRKATLLWILARQTQWLFFSSPAGPKYLPKHLKRSLSGLHSEEA